MLATEQRCQESFRETIEPESACQKSPSKSSLFSAKTSCSLDSPPAEYKQPVSVTDLANICHQIQSDLDRPKGENEERPFSRLRMWHIGSPQDVGMTSLPFIYKTLALFVRADLPELDTETLKQEGYEEDLIARARKYQKYAKHPGGYTHPQGCLGFREEIAQWFETRDGHKCDPNTVFLTNGASEALPTLLHQVIQSDDDAVLLPCPTFFLWEQAVRAHGGHVEFYRLSETQGFSLELDKLKEAYARAKSKGLTVRALIVINPGNPVPMLLSRDTIAKIVRFCEEKEILLIADEVYQMNAYKRPFVSFRQVTRDLNATLVLASLHSASKGVYGEGGHRAGLFQLEGADNATLARVRGIRDLAINPNNSGQVVMTLSLNPPLVGADSYEEFTKESERRLMEFKQKARMAQDFFNSLRDVLCEEVQGGMFVFPQIKFPKAYVIESNRRGVEADKAYVEDLLRCVGVCVIPGSSLGSTAGQRDGWSHLRVTIIALPDDMREGFRLWRMFHEEFHSRYE